MILKNIMDKIQLDNRYRKDVLQYNEMTLFYLDGYYVIFIVRKILLKEKEKRKKVMGIQ